MPAAWAAGCTNSLPGHFRKYSPRPLAIQAAFFGDLVDLKFQQSGCAAGIVLDVFRNGLSQQRILPQTSSRRNHVSMAEGQHFEGRLLSWFPLKLMGLL